jgi:hypothetical protein
MRWSPLKLSKGILGKPGKGLLLLALWFLLQAAANSPSFHLTIHPDAGSPDHQCVVKLLSSGQVDTAANDVSLVVAVVPLAVYLPESPFPVRNFFQLPPGRGPPAFPA